MLARRKHLRRWASLFWRWRFTNRRRVGLPIAVLQDILRLPPSRSRDQHGAQRVRTPIEGFAPSGTGGAAWSAWPIRTRRTQAARRRMPARPCRPHGNETPLRSHPVPRLTQAPNLAIATLWADALAAAGISTSVQRQYLAGVAGELPPDQCLPEVWIHDPEQESAARDLLHHLRHVPQRRWHCSCGELVEGGFEHCWNCALPMPPAAA